MTTRLCRQCQNPLPADAHCNARVCSDACRVERSRAASREHSKTPKAREAKRLQEARRRERVRAANPLRTTCVYCSGPMVTTSSNARFCSNKCRKANHMAQFGGLDWEGEIPVVDIDAAPRRLAVARLFERWDIGLGDGEPLFDHVTAPQWINPQDKRASR